MSGRVSASTALSMSTWPSRPVRAHKSPSKTQSSRSSAGHQTRPQSSDETTTKRAPVISPSTAARSAGAMPSASSTPPNVSAAPGSSKTPSSAAMRPSSRQGCHPVRNAWWSESARCGILQAGFSALGRQRPRCRVQVDLIPAHPGCLTTAPAACIDQHSETRQRGIALLLECPPQRADLGVGQGAVPHSPSTSHALAVGKRTHALDAALQGVVVEAATDRHELLRRAGLQPVHNAHDVRPGHGGDGTPAERFNCLGGTLGQLTSGLASPST